MITIDWNKIVNDKFVFIIRGLPGSGTEVISNALSAGGFPVISAYDFFPGKIFNKEGMAAAYKDCFERFKTEISKDTPLIVVHNPNIKTYHYYHYLDYAQRMGYIVSVVTLPHNTYSDKELSDKSGVELNFIRQMRRQFEWEISDPKLRSKS